MRAPRRISPAARARRALLVDMIAAVILAALVLTITAGLGVAVFSAVPVLLIGILSLLVERGYARSRRGLGRQTKAIGRSLE